LDAKIEEFAKYRRDAHTQQVTLQSAFDALTHDYDSCKAELDSLKRTHEKQRHQLTAVLDKVNSLQDQLAEEGAASRVQAETQTRLIELLEKRNAEAKKRVEDVDNEWDRTIREHQETEERLKEQLRREKERADRLDANITRVIESSEGSGTFSSASPEPNAGANFVASFMKGTKISDLFEENRRVKDELQKVKIENVRLTDTTSQLISKMQEMASNTSSIFLDSFDKSIRHPKSASNASSMSAKSMRLSNFRSSFL
jgi:nucleoprotein TPR